VKRIATISKCGKYRYWLERQWSEHGDFLNWIMLNPSTADANCDDPTVRKCCSFAKRWGYSGIHITNLFAYRVTDPRLLLQLFRSGTDIIGPENGMFVEAGVYSAPRTVIAWGATDFANQLGFQVLQKFDPANFCALGFNQNGSPKHPLYVPLAAPLVDLTGSPVANDNRSVAGGGA
jgi:hypothetical protein